MSPVAGHSSNSFPYPPGHAAPRANDPELDEQFVRETRQQIRELVQEITQLSQAEVAPEEFFAGALPRMISALAATGGAVWLRNETDTLEMGYRANLNSELTELFTPRHTALLNRVANKNQALAAPPHSGFPDDDSAGNPTDYLLLLAPIVRDEKNIGLIEVLQRAGAGPTTQRGYLRFLLQMSELTGEFLRNHKLREFAERETLWNKLTRFLSEIHRSIDLKETAFTFVNEARVFLECDRVSLALLRGSSHEISAMSGVNSLNTRSEQVKLLGRLNNAVMASGEPFWSSTELMMNQAELAPQLAMPLQNYVDRSQTRAIAVLPIRMAQQGEAGDSMMIGALILENISAVHWNEPIRQRAKVLLQYATPAIQHAIEHERVSWFGWNKLLGRNRLAANRFGVVRSTAMVIGILALLAFAICPWPLEIAARGQVQPSRLWHIFAPESGTITSISARHGQTVQPGDVLLVLSNTEIEVQLAGLLGRQRVVREQIQTTERAILEQGRGKLKLTSTEENRLSGELPQLKQSLAGIESELTLVREKEKRLVVKTEHAGEIVTWQPEQTLLRRPVRPGQTLLTVVDPAGAWELELLIPERHMRHVEAARSNNPERILQVSFLLATHPGQEYLGELREIERTVEAHGEQGRYVLARVTFEKNQLPPLRGDTSVTAKIDCGRSVLGYVLFCDLFDAMQSRLLFWF